MFSLLMVVDTILSLYMWVLIIGAILSWLVAFNVINTRNSFVAGTIDFLDRLTEPVLRPVRKRIKPINGIDVAPLVVYFALMFVRLLIRNNAGMFL